MELAQTLPESAPFSHPLQPLADEYYGRIWAGRHSQDSQKTGGKFKIIEARTLPYHDINQALVPVAAESLTCPDEEFFARLEASLGWAFKSMEQASAFICDIKNAPTSPTDKTPLIETINKLQAGGANIGLLMSHAFLMDIGYGLAALSAARGKTEYLAQNVTLLSKTLAYESFNDQPTVELGEAYTNVIFVSPRTKTAIDIGVPDELAAAVNAKSGRALKPFTDKGALLVVALPGAGVIRERDQDDQLIGLEFPPIDDAGARLTEKMDYALTMAMWQDPETKEISWKIGSLRKVPKPEARLAADQRRIFNKMVADSFQLDLQRKLKHLSGLPTEYQPAVSRTEARAQGGVALRAFLAAA